MIWRASSRSGAVPEGIDADRLNIDALFVHVLQSTRSQDEVAAGEQILEGCRQRPVLDDVLHLRDETVTVHVDDLDATAADGNLTAPRRAARPLRTDPDARQAARQHESRCPARHVFQELPATAHGILLSANASVRPPLVWDAAGRPAAGDAIAHGEGV